MVELRKRPAPKETPTPAPAAKRSTSKARPAPKTTTKASTKTDTAKDKPADKAQPKPKASAAKDETKSDATAKEDSTSSSSFPLSASSSGTTVPISNLNSTIKLNTDESTSISKLLASAKQGIVIFSYPKASTPGCTTQACLFRDSYKPLTEAGLGVYGLSADSPKSNTTFVTKQNLPFELLCDADGVVSGPLGLKKPNPAKGTVRGVVVLTKVGDGDSVKVEVCFLGGPQKTLDVVLEWVEKEGKAKL